MREITNKVSVQWWNPADGWMLLMGVDVPKAIKDVRHWFGPTFLIHCAHTQHNLLVTIFIWTPWYRQHIGAFDELWFTWRKWTPNRPLVSLRRRLFNNFKLFPLVAIDCDGGRWSNTNLLFLCEVKQQYQNTTKEAGSIQIVSLVIHISWFMMVLLWGQNRSRIVIWGDVWYVSTYPASLWFLAQTWLQTHNCIGLSYYVNW